MLSVHLSKQNLSTYQEKQQQQQKNNNNKTFIYSAKASARDKNNRVNKILLEPNVV